MKNEILKIINEDLKDVEGIENLIGYLENGTDFFTAPASTIFHGNGDGGLAEHSLNVYHLLVEEAKISGLEYPQRTLAICGLFHDICKINYYKKSWKWDKEHKDKTGEWRKIDAYEVEDNFPVGHGEKSVIMLQRFIKLTDEEILAIRWHMGCFSPGVHFNYPDGYAYKRAQEMSKLVTLLFMADLKATKILEVIDTNKINSKNK
jgi:HD superfamily phosphohydrolase YqeK